MTGGYLARRGKKRFCDKSLSSARSAGLLLRIYPQARFVCLYRHPMDMIRSGLDACPWGLNGYGFDHYAASSPGNAVLALARYWLDNATAIAAFEEQHPDRCHRVRYEDLVTAPEETAADLFGFLGAAPAPGITERCFTGERERFGPADYKIWATSAITGDSVGRGESVPAGLIPQPVKAAVNELAGKLGYLPVDEEWGAPGRAADPRIPETAKTPVVPSAGGGPLAQPDAPGAALLEETLRTGLAGISDRFTSRWNASLPGKFLVVSRTPAIGEGGESGWVVDLTARTVTPDTTDNDGTEITEPDDVKWTILGSPHTWQEVLSGQVNLHGALRRADLRYASTDEEGPLATESRVAMLADLLGLSPWQQRDTRLADPPTAALTAAVPS
jgi:hypothetical protein